MIIAVIPWADKFNNNEIFNVMSPTNQNGLAEPFADMKSYIESQGHEIRTIDLVTDYDKVDVYLFFDWIEKWIDKLTRLGQAHKLVYCNAEPPTVRSLNTVDGYRTVRKFFPYIMTWNKNFVDDKVFFYRTIPYNFEDHKATVSFEDKKLLCSISANKKSDYVDELYTERERLITFFENKVPDQFDMYGVGWADSGHPSYKGSPKSKFDTYDNYKFALALENTRNVRGYVTEKIFDCLTGNVVPVYYGADDILDYVPKDCFIDYRDFDNPQALLDYLLSIDDKKYADYISAAKKAVAKIKADGTFSGARYGKNVLDLAGNAHNTKFSIDATEAKKLHIRVIKNKYITKVKQIIKGIIK